MDPSIGEYRSEFIHLEADFSENVSSFLNTNLLITPSGLKGDGSNVFFPYYEPEDKKTSDSLSDICTSFQKSTERLRKVDSNPSKILLQFLRVIENASKRSLESIAAFAQLPANSSGLHDITEFIGEETMKAILDLISNHSFQNFVIESHSSGVLLASFISIFEEIVMVTYDSSLKVSSGELDLKVNVLMGLSVVLAVQQKKLHTALLTYIADLKSVKSSISAICSSVEFKLVKSADFLSSQVADRLTTTFPGRTAVFEALAHITRFALFSVDNQLALVEDYERGLYHINEIIRVLPKYSKIFDSLMFTESKSCNNVCFPDTISEILSPIVEDTREKIEKLNEAAAKIQRNISSTTSIVNGTAPSTAREGNGDPTGGELLTSSVVSLDENLIIPDSHCEQYIPSLLMLSNTVHTLKEMSRKMNDFVSLLPSIEYLNSVPLYGVVLRALAVLRLNMEDTHHFHLLRLDIESKLTIRESTSTAAVMRRVDVLLSSVLSTFELPDSLKEDNYYLLRTDVLRRVRGVLEGQEGQLHVRSPRISEAFRNCQFLPSKVNGMATRAVSISLIHLVEPSLKLHRSDSSSRQAGFDEEIPDYLVGLCTDMETVSVDVPLLDHSFLLQQSFEKLRAKLSVGAQKADSERVDRSVRLDGAAAHQASKALQLHSISLNSSSEADSISKPSSKSSADSGAGAKLGDVSVPSATLYRLEQGLGDSSSDKKIISDLVRSRNAKKMENEAFSDAEVLLDARLLRQATLTGGSIKEEEQVDLNAPGSSRPRHSKSKADRSKTICVAQLAQQHITSAITARLLAADAEAEGPSSPVAGYGFPCESARKNAADCLTEEAVLDAVRATIFSNNLENSGKEPQLTRQTNGSPKSARPLADRIFKPLYGEDPFSPALQRALLKSVDANNNFVDGFHDSEGNFFPSDSLAMHTQKVASPSDMNSASIPAKSADTPANASSANIGISPRKNEGTETRTPCTPSASNFNSRESRDLLFRSAYMTVFAMKERASSLGPLLGAFFCECEGCGRAQRHFMREQKPLISLSSPAPLEFVNFSIARSVLDARVSDPPLTGPGGVVGETFYRADGSVLHKTDGGAPLAPLDPSVNLSVSSTGTVFKVQPRLREINTSVLSNFSAIDASACVASRELSRDKLDIDTTASAAIPTDYDSRQLSRDEIRRVALHELSQKLRAAVSPHRSRVASTNASTSASSAPSDQNDAQETLSRPLSALERFVNATATKSKFLHWYPLNFETARLLSTPLPRNPASLSVAGQQCIQDHRLLRLSALEELVKNMKYPEITQLVRCHSLSSLFGTLQEAQETLSRAVVKTLMLRQCLMNPELISQLKQPSVFGSNSSSHSKEIGRRFAEAFELRVFMAALLLLGIEPWRFARARTALSDVLRNSVSNRAVTSSLVAPAPRQYYSSLTPPNVNAGSVSGTGSPRAGRNNGFFSDPSDPGIEESAVDTLLEPFLSFEGYHWTVFFSNSLVKDTAVRYNRAMKKEAGVLTSTPRSILDTPREATTILESARSAPSSADYADSGTNNGSLTTRSTASSFQLSALTPRFPNTAVVNEALEPEEEKDTAGEEDEEELSEEALKLLEACRAALANASSTLSLIPSTSSHALAHAPLSPRSTMGAMQLTQLPTIAPPRVRNLDFFSASVGSSFRRFLKNSPFSVDLEQLPRDSASSVTVTVPAPISSVSASFSPLDTVERGFADGRGNCVALTAQNASAVNANLLVGVDAAIQCGNSYTVDKRSADPFLSVDGGADAVKTQQREQAELAAHAHDESDSETEAVSDFRGDSRMRRMFSNPFRKGTAGPGSPPEKQKLKISSARANETQSARHPLLSAMAAGLSVKPLRRAFGTLGDRAADTGPVGLYEESRKDYSDEIQLDTSRRIIDAAAAEGAGDVEEVDTFVRTKLSLQLPSSNRATASNSVPTSSRVFVKEFGFENEAEVDRLQKLRFPPPEALESSLITLTVLDSASNVGAFDALDPESLSQRLQLRILEDVTSISPGKTPQLPQNSLISHTSSASSHQNVGHIGNALPPRINGAHSSASSSITSTSLYSVHSNNSNLLMFAPSKVDHSAALSSTSSVLEAGDIKTRTEPSPAHQERSPALLDSQSLSTDARDSPSVTLSLNTPVSLAVHADSLASLCPVEEMRSFIFGSHVVTSALLGAPSNLTEDIIQILGPSDGSQQLKSQLLGTGDIPDRLLNNSLVQDPLHALVLAHALVRSKIHAQRLGFPTIIGTALGGDRSSNSVSTISSGETPSDPASSGLSEPSKGVSVLREPPKTISASINQYRDFSKSKSFFNHNNTTYSTSDNALRNNPSAVQIATNGSGNSVADALWNDAEMNGLGLLRKERVASSDKELETALQNLEIEEKIHQRVMNTHARTLRRLAHVRKIRAALALLHIPRQTFRSTFSPNSPSNRSKISGFADDLVPFASSGASFMLSPPTAVLAAYITSYAEASLLSAQLAVKMSSEAVSLLGALRLTEAQRNFDYCGVLRRLNSGVIPYFAVDKTFTEESSYTLATTTTAPTTTANLTPMASSSSTSTLVHHPRQIPLSSTKEQVLNLRKKEQLLCESETTRKLYQQQQALARFSQANFNQSTQGRDIDADISDLHRLTRARARLHRPAPAPAPVVSPPRQITYTYTPPRSIIVSDLLPSKEFTGSVQGAELIRKIGLSLEGHAIRGFEYPFSERNAARASLNQSENPEGKRPHVGGIYHYDSRGGVRGFYDALNQHLEAFQSKQQQQQEKEKDNSGDNLESRSKEDTVPILQADSWLLSTQNSLNSALPTARLDALPLSSPYRQRQARYTPHGAHATPNPTQYSSVVSGSRVPVSRTRGLFDPLQAHLQPSIMPGASLKSVNSVPVLSSVSGSTFPPSSPLVLFSPGRSTLKSTASSPTKSLNDSITNPATLGMNLMGGSNRNPYTLSSMTQGPTPPAISVPLVVPVGEQEPVHRLLAMQPAGLVASNTLKVASQVERVPKGEFARLPY